MPRIRDEFLDCSIYLYRSQHEAEEGIEVGGSGFLVKVPAKRLPPPNGAMYAVTNKHVIHEGATVVRVNTADGYSDVFAFGRDRWITSASDDLAVCPMPALERGLYRLKTVETPMFLTEELARHYNVGIGDEAFMVGRFIDHAGKQRNNPSARFGAIAQMPGEPVALSIGSAIHEQESFLVEVRSIGGYSGSPVFLRMDQDHIRPERPGVRPTQFYLLGIDWGHFPAWEPVCGADRKPLPGLGHCVEMNSGIACVVPAWKLLALLEREELVRAREAGEEQALRHRAMPAAVTDGSPTCHGDADDEQTG